MGSAVDQREHDATRPSTTKHPKTRMRATLTCAVETSCHPSGYLLRARAACERGEVRAGILVVSAGCAATIVVAAVAGAQPADGSGAPLDAAPVDAAPPDAAPADAVATPDAIAIDAAVDAPMVDAAPAPTPLGSVTDTRIYATTHLQVSFDGRPLERVSAGLAFRTFSSDGGAFEIRGGVSAYVSQDLDEPYKRPSGGLGGELEVIPSAGDRQLGFRAGIESFDRDIAGPFVTVGARGYLTPNVFLSVDLYYFLGADTTYDPGTMTTVGGLFGIGFTGQGRIRSNRDESPAQHAKLQVQAQQVSPAPTDEDARRKAREHAWRLLDDATKAALGGHCAAVERIAAQVRKLDPDFYTRMFITDQFVERCHRRPAP